MKGKRLYIDEISFSSIFSLVKYCIIHRLNYSIYPHIFYVDASVFWGHMAKITNQIFCPVEKLNFAMRNVRDLEGELLRIRIHRKDLFEIKKRIESAKVVMEVSNNLDEFQKLYLNKGMVDASITENYSVSRVLFLIGVIEWYERKYSDEIAFFLLRERPWIQIYKEYADGLGVKLISYQELFIFKEKDRFSSTLKRIPSIYVFFRAIKSLGSLKLCLPKCLSGPKIFVEGRGHINFSNDGQHSDFYWMKSGQISPQTLVYSPVGKIERKKLISHLISPTKICISQILAEIFSDRFFSPSACKLSWSKENRLIARMLRSYKCSYIYWRSLFRSNNVKIFLTWYRYENQHITITSAIRSLNGVSVYLPVAFDGWENVEGLTRTDVSFCYSNFGSMIEDKCLSQSEYRIIIGYPRDYAVDLLRPAALKVRQGLMQNGAKKIIFAIDENSLDDERWHTGHELQCENYSYVLEALLQNDWLGVIFKPKNARNLYERLGPVAELLQRAKSTGRCHIYDEVSRDLTAASPLLAGLSADLCIHGHLCSGTAALECSLAGLPTLLIDREGVPSSKLRELPIGKVVFDNWKNAMDSTINYFKNPEVDSEFGSWAKILHELDPYRDGMSSIRIGYYLKTLHKGFEDGLSRESALENAANLFAIRWGSDKVIRA